MSVSALNDQERKRNEKLTRIVISAIQNSDDKAISFGQFMNLALYEPIYGYYSASSNTIGAAGDFVTAPELGSLFGESVARKLAQSFAQFDGPRHVYEFGAGNGSLAVQILTQLSDMDCRIDSYEIFELSPMLRDIQEQTINTLKNEAANKVNWYTHFPSKGLEGMVIANELLDALPVELFLAEHNGVLQAYVVQTDNGLSIDYRQQIQPDFSLAYDALELAELPVPYMSELHLRAEAWMRTVSENLVSGSILISDYGFSQKEYYHPDRRQGTLMCHRRQQINQEPLERIGCQDITAHVNFSRIAQIASEAGMDVNGYTSLAAFVIDTGVIREPDCSATPAERARYCHEVDTLTSPSEMGEMFKVIELTKNFDSSAFGFETVDRTYSLNMDR